MTNARDFEDGMLTLPSRTTPSPAARNCPLRPPEIKRYDHLFKLIIIGDQSVGKTNLTMKFCDYDFSPHYVATIGIDFKIRTIDVSGKRVKLQIWDTAGQERFQSISKMYYRGAHGVLFVYDVTHPPSFENVRRWISAYQEASGDTAVNTDIPKVLIGNKCDDLTNRKVTTGAGQLAAISFHLKYFETSAKTGHNVAAVFTYLAEEILLRKEKESPQLKVPRTRLKKKHRNSDSRKGGWSWSSCNLL